MDSLRPAQVCLRRLALPQRPTKRLRCLHTSIANSANPTPHPTIPGPPPQSPAPDVSRPEDRVARKRKQLELIKKGQEIRANTGRPTSVLQKRFWKDVKVEESPGLQIHLDKRPVRAAGKSILNLPYNKFPLATAIALEWDLLVSAQQALKYHYIPLTSLASRAVDIDQADAKGEASVRDEIVKVMMRYLRTDTLLCWAPERSVHDAPMYEQSEERTKSLRQVQEEGAMPIVEHLTTVVWPGLEIQPVLDNDSILPAPQSPMTIEVIKSWMSGLPAYELAGLERGVLATKSLLVAVRLLVEWSQEFAHLRPKNTKIRRFGIEEAAEACTAEVKWQTDMWGEVEDTHDVEKEDLRRQLGSVVLLVSG
ncbi:F1-ATP synthase assembly protein [Aulographum hederae CBS 113979]|uniref:F1-ATP synthase assembly protein n=1 Tax=Aulographum hederae CBS 113979 TaxID=1176131 RepID=A0A6G1H1R3_9PEZI|nr:F1-ATP synthase assembly protein [Aulographum hederae CBS 113979]